MIPFIGDNLEQPVSVIYTLVNREQLFADLSPDQGMPVRELKMGPRTIVLGYSNSGFRVNQLLSTDPADYLNPLWQPGIEWHL